MLARTQATAWPVRSGRPALSVRVHQSRTSIKTASAMSSLDIASIRAKSNEALSCGGHNMFCYQCEQTFQNTGCTDIGICGKTPEVAALQDLLVFALKGLGSLAHIGRQHGIVDQEVNSFINGALFSTLTNVNFSDSRFKDEFLPRAAALESRMRYALAGKGLSDEAGIDQRRAALGETLLGLQELLVYGLKGLCAYAHHAEALGGRDERVYAFVQEALWFLCEPASRDADQVLAMCMRCGETNFLVMQMLSDAHASSFGVPTPTRVSLNPVPGKAILVTGHDMHDMDLLLKQTEGKGVNVYTHGEMLPAFSYPGLKRHPHLVAHFGGAWYKQKFDFAKFPGSVLVTTNCVLEPLDSYKSNIFTTNETGLSGITHLGSKDFTPLIQRALEMDGFREGALPMRAAEEGRVDTVTVGFGHQAVLGVADQVIDAVKTGKLEHIFLVGGCDGAEGQRSYYSKLYSFMPPTTMMLTLGCGKFRIFDQDFGNLPGTDLPRLLDMGQCNDAYSAIVVATELAKAFDCDVNALPLSLDLSWFEQKAVAVLLTLLHLGIKNIRLGPRLPAFLTDDAVALLVDKFGLMPADTAHPERDLKAMMANS